VALSSLTMYYLLTTLRHRRLGSLLGAIGYMFSRGIVSRIAIGHVAFVYEYSLAPLAFAFSEKALLTGRLRYAICAGVNLMQLQAGALTVLGNTRILIFSYVAAHRVLSCCRDWRILSGISQSRPSKTTSSLEVASTGMPRTKY
jgi:hypothetical protein